MKKAFILIGVITLLLIGNQIPVQAATIEKAKDTLIKTTVTTGDGLYKDEYEEGRYIYKGANPNNYLTFNDETAGWRILSVEKDGTLKIIKNQSIGKMIYNTENTGTYCDNNMANSYGCNAWAATNNLTDKTKEFSNTVKTGTVLKDSNINILLNNKYYANLTDKAKKYIISHNFAIGGTSTTNLHTMIQNEKNYQWNGKIGLINYTDFLRTYNNNDQSWIKRGKTLTPNAYTQTDESTIATFLTSKNFYPTEAYSRISESIYPVIYLNSNISLTGSGTPDDPYTIADILEIKFETFGDLEKDLLYRLESTGMTLENIKQEINNQIGTKIEENGKCCTLDSWYLDKDLKTRFDEDTPINSNLTLYGKWSCADVVNVPNTSIYIQKWILITGICITVIGIIIIGLVIKKKKKKQGV